ncbi:MAG: alkaline phosphatase family protein [Mucilaginibacter polytrichastri]|nr:alkaline phosphatase family protein [Mucilaginibacter polytrichastri]
MKRTFSVLLLLAGLSLHSSAQKNGGEKGTPGQIARPKLVVGIVVDQMRWDYLYRFYDRYKDGGFKRLLGEGFTCDNTLVPYVPTVTAAGHTCVYTGSVPAIHGIAGNDWVIQAKGQEMYCTEDKSVKTIGSTSDAGEMSPKNLLASTVTDELKLATNFQSKVIGIAIKDRGGILPAGHAANAAYWFDDLTGNWITSTFYMKDLPDWLKKFNNQKLADKYLNQKWETLYPINTYTLSAPDDSPYEGKYRGMDKATLPVDLAKVRGKDFGQVRATPFGNTMTLEMAKAALKNENMGKGKFTDFLTISFSSTDYIGHQFGPNSVEVEDTYLRLDQDFADLFKTLDGQVGAGNYTVFLTADHAVAHNPQFLIDHKIPAGYWPSKELMAELNKQLAAKYKVENLVLSQTNYQLNLNNAGIAQNKLDEEAIIADCIAFLQKQNGVAFAVESKKAAESNLPDPIKKMVVNGYNSRNSGAVWIIFEPGWYTGSPGATGSTHSAWQPYDAHIPFVLMGWGIKQGSLKRETYMTDIAPTIAALLHIQQPNGNVGHVVTEALKE